MAKLSIFLTLLIFIPLCFSFDPDQPMCRHLLVLLDDFAIRSLHSIFFGYLESHGYDLAFKVADDPKICLHRYKKYLYDDLVLFAPGAHRFGGSVTVASVLDFGHDLILAADTSSSELIREIATECGVDFEEDAAANVDFTQSDAILGTKKIEAPVIFQGIGHSVNPSNGFVLKVLSASPAAYSSNSELKLSNPPSLVGSAISLISVMQARNNARVLISGSLSVFSNRFFRSKVQKSGSSIIFEKAGNEQFLTGLSKWVFHERGHLKAINVRHNKVGDAYEPSVYRMNDDLEYFVQIYEWSGTSWEPYVADDVQIQFYMMSPYVLKTMKTDEKGLYYAKFKVPDVYGVFQFKLEYSRLGYTSLSLSKQIPVRPFRHNEYERFIPAAYPYYGAAFSMMVGFFVFSAVFLYHK